MKTTYTVIDPSGLHARPASLLVQVSTKYPNDITITFKDKTVSLKSILAVMTLGIPQNETFTITVEGDNQQEITSSLEQILKEHNVI